jgi:uracil-DNA glycosylase
LKTIESLNKNIASCKKCPRLSVYIRDVAKNKVRRFKEEKYYGKPLSGFGDIKAKLLIVGLAPAAHGGNRTGRMFTGDSSGDWLFKVRSYTMHTLLQQLDVHLLKTNQQKMKWKLVLDI